MKMMDFSVLGTLVVNHEPPRHCSALPQGIRKTVRLLVVGVVREAKACQIEASI